MYQNLLLFYISMYYTDRYPKEAKMKEKAREGSTYTNFSSFFMTPQGGWFFFFGLFFLTKTKIDKVIAEVS